MVQISVIIPFLGNDTYLDSKTICKRLYYSADTKGWGQYTLDKDYTTIFVIISAAEPNISKSPQLQFSTTCSNIKFTNELACVSNDDRGSLMKFVVIGDAKQGDVINMYGSFYTIRLVLAID